MLARSIASFQQAGRSLMMMKNLYAFALTCFLFTAISFVPVYAQRELGVRGTSSGGRLMPEQAAYDVKSYDLNLRVNPEAQTIKGVLTAHARIVHPLNWFVLDLDTPFTVEAVTLAGAMGRNAPQSLNFERRGGQLWISFPATKQPGEEVRVRVAYNGKPRVAPRPPWVGGFIWARTPSGQHWINVACQMDGADLWFPVKDHPSDEPETVSLHFTVPQPLVAASNGRLQTVVKNADGTQTFNWLVSEPINNYNITLNVAPYKMIEDSYLSIAGERVPVKFWVLPEDYEKGRGIVAQTKDFLRFFEEYLGPYPFRSEKVGIVQTQHLGMEHQTLIAYGNNFRNNEHGFDWLMLHELGHEWWGNLVTASDWRDFWIHEGFQSFMDSLYIGRVSGEEAYMQHMANRMKNTRNKQPVSPRESRTTTEMYMAAPDYLSSDGDIYGKGAVILHTLRYLLGDKAFFTALRRMAYPAAQMEKLKGGRQTRFVTTDDFMHIAERVSRKKLGWFFEVYLRQPKLPKLVTRRDGNQLTLRWDTPDDLPFPMPVEVQVGGVTKRYEMPQGTAVVTLEPGQSFTVDPKNWILKAQ
jgi:aminopeptidase N